MSDTKDKREFCAGPDASHYAYMSKATQPDMTPRDYFAAKAMQGMTAAIYGLDDASEERLRAAWEKAYGNVTWAEALADQAYSIAEAMIKRREQ